MEALRGKIRAWKEDKKDAEARGTFRISEHTAMQADFRELASIAHQNGGVVEAESVANEGITLWGDSSRFASILGDARMAQGKCEQAIVAYKEGAEDSDVYQNEHWISLVLAYYRCGKRDEAHQLSAE